MNRLETQQIYMDTAGINSGQSSLTPFFYSDKGVGRYTLAGQNPTASVVFSSQKNLTGLSHTNRSLPPEFVFSAEYFTIPIETEGEFGWINNSNTLDLIIDKCLSAVVEIIIKSTLLENSIILSTFEKHLSSGKLFSVENSLNIFIMS